MTTEAAGVAPSEGWGRPPGSYKWHYIRGSRALCSRWLYFGDLEEGDDHNSTNCAACKRLRLKELQAKGGE